MHRFSHTALLNFLLGIPSGRIYQCADVNINSRGFSPELLSMLFVTTDGD